jgi:hypothetical protein
LTARAAFFGFFAIPQSDRRNGCALTELVRRDTLSRNGLDPGRDHDMNPPSNSCTSVSLLARLRGPQID